MPRAYYAILRTLFLLEMGELQDLLFLKIGLRMWDVMES